jgi:two-component system CheB/CheR fusion protein
MLDITERKVLDMQLAERTEQLRDEHNFINAVLDTQAALVLVMDAEGRVVQFNRAYETATGYDFEALQDCNACWELVPDEKREAVQQVIATLQAGATLVEHESQLLCRDGSKRLIFWRNTTLRDKAGRLRYIIKTGIDVTDQRRVEEEAHERLEEASRLQRLHTANELATVLAHELNQPLAAIAMNAKAVQNLLQDQNGPPDLGLIGETVQRIQQQSVRAGESIRQLRAFVSRGKLDPHPIDLNGVLLDACGLIRAKMKARNIRLQFELDASLPPVMGVEVHVEQVLLNLLRNGIEAIDEAGMHDGTVTVTSSLVQNMAQVSVCDTGPGIDANLAARLFGQLESTKVDGLGVGLRISRSLIEAQEGGRLWVEAHSPGGVFHFVLPLVKIAS